MSNTCSTGPSYGSPISPLVTPKSRKGTSSIPIPKREYEMPCPSSLNGKKVFGSVEKISSVASGSLHRVFPFSPDSEFAGDLEKEHFALKPSLLVSELDVSSSGSNVTTTSSQRVRKRSRALAPLQKEKDPETDLLPEEGLFLMSLDSD